MEQNNQPRYSYIRKPWSITGWYCLGIAAVTFVLTVVCIVLMMKTKANVSASVGAMGLSCIILDTMGLIFAVIGLREADKNQLFVRIGGIVCSALLILWLFITTLGVR